MWPTRPGIGDSHRNTRAWSRRRSSRPRCNSARPSCRHSSRAGSTLLDETGRWAFLKLVTGALRIGVSARLAKTAVAAIGSMPADEIEEVWHGLQPPYVDLFAWLEGRAERPTADDPAPFRPPMLAHAMEEADFAGARPGRFRRRMEMGRHPRAGGRRESTRETATRARLYSRTGEDMSRRLSRYGRGACRLRRRDRRRTAGACATACVQPFNVLQQRLNRKTVIARS